jgi:hypothetical protein
MGATAMAILLSTVIVAQQGNVKILFNCYLKSSGGYVAITNKFTKIRVIMPIYRGFMAAGTFIIN